ncbi:MAG: nuclear transport factor 2 family protein [Acidimicrobiales bacterium]|nr:nuclear transport factor 2 family protein [Acidimicrobiales bacterium]
MADTTPDELVRAFCAAWGTASTDELLAYFHDDAVYHNVPLDPAEGLDAIRGVIEMFAGMASSITFEVHHQVASGSIVMNERTDTIAMDGRTVALPVAGVFVVDGGKIRRWSDYFDMGQFTGS